MCIRDRAYIYYWKKGSKEGDKIVVIVLYIDDILITGNCNDKMVETKRQLAKEFKIKDLGEPKQFLGIGIKRDRERRIMELSQKKFVCKILEKFEMEEAKVCKTPIRTNQNKKAIRKTKDKIESKIELSKGMPYRQLIGSLLYLQESTRPDISL